MKARILDNINEYPIIKDDSDCERVLAISLDFDGDILHEEYDSLIKAGKTVEEALSKSNQKLIDWIVDLIKKGNYDRIVFLVGSNRQSHEVDKSHSGKNPSYSCFPVLETLFEIIKDKLSATDDAAKMVFDHYLLADSYGNKPCGENFSHCVQRNKNYRYDDFKFDDYKHNIIYAQTHHLAAIYPNAAIDYYLVDDMDGILSMIRSYGKDEKWNSSPKQVKVNLFRHQSSSHSESETDLISYGSFQGIRDADPSYQQRIQHNLSFKRKESAEGLLCLQQFFDDVNAKISALLHHSDDTRFITYLAHFRHYKTEHAKSFFCKRRYINLNNLDRDIQSLVTNYRKEFSEITRIISQLQSLLNELNNEVDNLNAMGNSQPATLFINAIKKFIVKTYEDIDVDLKDKASGNGDDDSINNTIKSLGNIVRQLKNMTFEENNVNADIKSIKTFQQQYELNSYIDYLYSMRYPLICGVLSGVTAVFLALYPTTESSSLGQNTRVTGLFFTCMSIISNVAWGYNNAVNSLLFHPSRRHINNDLKAVVQDMGKYHLQK